MLTNLTLQPRKRIKPPFAPSILSWGGSKTMVIRPRRSVLYMPGSNERALEKARSLAADGLILDLEDAVAPEAKTLARRQVADAVKAGGFGRREVVVRVNGLDTEWASDDIAAVAKSGADAILFPKIQSAADVLQAILLLEQ